jgi:hypothetical protein
MCIKAKPRDILWDKWGFEKICTNIFNRTTLATRYKFLCPVYVFVKNTCKIGQAHEIMLALGTICIYMNKLQYSWQHTLINAEHLKGSAFNAEVLLGVVNHGLMISFITFNDFQVDVLSSVFASRTEPPSINLY